MFRIVRASATGLRLQRSYNGSPTRLYLAAARLYSTKDHERQQQQQQRSDLCPPPPPKDGRGGGTGIGLTIAALALAGGAVIAYAKYDDDFRATLCEYAPWTDGVIRFAFQEDGGSYADGLGRLWASLKGALSLGGGGDDDDAQQRKRRGQPSLRETPKDYQPPSPLFPGVAKEVKEKDVVYNEIRLESKEKDAADPKVEIVDPKPAETPLPDDHPKNLAELEQQINASASGAIKAYNSAVFAMRSYNREVEELVDASADRVVDASVWSALRTKSAAKQDAISRAEEEAASATKNLRKLRELLQRNHFGLSADVREQAERNLAKVTKDIADARAELEAERRTSALADKYWTRVREARDAFAEELRILFPGVDIDQKKLNLGDGDDLDLFVLQALAKVLFYQKELYKRETLGDEKLARAIDAAKREGFEALTAEQICQEVDKARRTLEDEFQKKCLKLRQENEKELRQQLKMQSEAFADHLNDAVKTREIELEQKLTRVFDEQMTEEKCKYKLKVASMVGRLRGLDGAIRARAEADKSAHQAQVLWSACQALYKSIKVGCPGLPWTDQLRPLEPEINAVQSAAADNDELVKVVVKGIPDIAKNRGVYPEDALRERFIKVEKVARRVALVPEAGARLHMYLLSYLQSMLLVKAANPIPQSELNDEQTDFTDMSTYEILQRARYWIDRGDFAQTLRYMNLLKGAPRTVAKEWMDETRILLETQQAANTLMAHAAASGLIYL